MKALRFIAEKTLEITTMPEPVLEGEDVLVRVRGCGVCGSDVHGWLGLTGRRIPPMTMGHEFAGEIAECGKDVQGYRRGDLVAVQPINFCGSCAPCRQGLTNMCTNKRFFGVLDEDGAMAEYVAVPQKLLYRLPDGFDCRVAAMAEPYAVAFGSVAKAGDVEGKTVLIIGAGMIGQCILQNVLLRKPGAVIVSDLSESRLKIAKELGANHTVNTKKDDFFKALQDLTDESMIDICFEAVGIEATANQSIKCLKVGGKAIWVGMSQKEMTINMQDIVCSARTVLGSFNYTHAEFGCVVDLLVQGRLDYSTLLSKIVALNDAPAAFKALHERPGDYLKIVIDPTI